MDENVWEEVIQVNPAQAAFLVMPYKNGYVIYSRATGKSFITGAVIDDNIRPHAARDYYAHPGHHGRR